MFALLIPLVLTTGAATRGHDLRIERRRRHRQSGRRGPDRCRRAADLSAPGGVAAAVAHIQANPQASSDLAAKLADLQVQMQKEQDAEAEAAAPGCAG